MTIFMHHQQFYGLDFDVFIMLVRIFINSLQSKIILLSGDTKQALIHSQDFITVSFSCKISSVILKDENQVKIQPKRLTNPLF